jgi:hypothetical protein
VNEYFSYEHFYVLYCKFWELDTDRDFLLSREDLSKMDNLTHTVLDRIFSQAGRRFTSGHPDKMGYEDFVCAFSTLVVVCGVVARVVVTVLHTRRFLDVRGGQNQCRVAAVLVPRD